jgi:tRNA(Ile)-lysidine synthase TilS/MesJ
MNEALTYSSWKIEHRRILEALPGKQIIVTYSGGKDSSVVLHYMIQAAKEFDFHFETHAAEYPEHVFTRSDKHLLDAYWRERGVAITWHAVSGSEEKLNRALTEGINPCVVCNRVKKSVLIEYFKRVATDWEPLVLVMGYSLWDLISATVEHILTARLSHPDESPSPRVKPTEERFIETSQRFYPILKLNGGPSIFKPLIMYNDQDILDVVSRHAIPLTQTICKYKDFRPKRLFGEYYHRAALQFDYQKVFEFAKNVLDLPEPSYYENVDRKQYLKKMI